jgi:hypothetical protein
MFRLVRTFIVLALVAGIVVLGVKIHRKSVEMGSSLSQEASKIKDRVRQLAEEAVKETEELQKVYGNSDHSLAGTLGPGDRNGVTEKASPPKPVLSLPQQSKDEGVTPELQPLDEEDRVLTEEILDEGSRSAESENRPSKINEIYAQVSKPGHQLADDEGLEPPDLNRLTEVRKMYLKALETLDFD